MGFLFVALGGAVGAVCRYLISLIPYKGTFPVLTLITNLSGAFLIGVISGLASRKGWPDNAVLFLKTGVCGGFTTFSTFSLESYDLLRSHQTVPAVIYIVLSICMCLTGVFGGIYIVEH